jgi:hypothetical protein
MTLRDYLLAAHDRPFAWGVCDCALWVSDWIKSRRGFDPLARFRGTYRTARQCERILISERGGLLGVVSREFEAAGLERIGRDAVAPGDAVCVRGPPGIGKTIGLAVGGCRVAMKSIDGVIVSAEWPVLRAWRI